MNRKLIQLSVILLAVLLSGSISIGIAQPSRTERLKQAQRALRSDDLEVAEKLFRELIAENERDVRARVGLSDTLLRSRKVNEAFTHALYVVGQDESSARAHAILGTILRLSGDFPRAQAEFQKALSVKEDALATAGVAVIDFYENRLEKSLKGLKRAIWIDSSEPDYFFHLAQVSAKLERYEEAADAYTDFLAVTRHTDPNRRARIKGLIAFLRYLGGHRKLYQRLGAESTDIPLEVVGNRPFFTVRINGSQQTFRFVLDSGSGVTVISDQTAARLNLKPVARGGLANAVGGQFEIVYGLLSSLELGAVRVGNVPVYIRRFYHDDNPVDGYIGLPFLSKFLTKINYGAGRLSLTLNPSKNTAHAAGNEAEFEIPVRMTSAGFLSGDVQLEGLDQSFNFIIDTGASVSVVARGLESLDQVRAFRSGGTMRIFGAAGIQENVGTRLVPKMSFGRYGQANVLAAVLDLEDISDAAGYRQMGIVGGNFLRHFQVVFDLNRSVVSLLPPTNENESQLRKQ